MIQHLSHLCSQGIRGERLLQEVDSRVQSPGMDGGIARVAGHVEDWKVGPSGLKGVGQVVSLDDSGQDDIGEQKIDRALALR